jgi:hypothetical protein
LQKLLNLDLRLFSANETFFRLGCFVVGRRWKCVIELRKADLRCFSLKLVKYAQTIVSDGGNGAWLFGMANQVSL